MIQVIVFTRNRPLQLDGYLRSLDRQCLDSRLVDVKILSKNDGEYPEHEAAFRQSDNFLADVKTLVGFRDEPYTMFGCDDVVFIHPFTVERITKLIETRKLLGFSLRLGKNVTHNMFSGVQPQPVRIRPYWLVDQAEGDWAYPWELDGTIYPTEFVEAVLQESQAKNPNELEDGGSRHWSGCTQQRRMGCFETSRLVVSTVNRVQDGFANPVYGGGQLSAKFLLDCWRAGLRMDIDRFSERHYDRIHVPNFYLETVP